MVTPFRREIDHRSRELAAALAGSHLRLATAESCTGGLLAARLAGEPRLGPHLDRGFIVYSPQSKIEVLGADPAAVACSDAVNMPLTESLARGALARSGADIAVAITGFCGPQQRDEEVGLIHIACVRANAPPAMATCHYGDIGREHVLERATAAALALVTRVVRERRAAQTVPRGEPPAEVQAAVLARPPARP